MAFAIVFVSKTTIKKESKMTNQIDNTKELTNALTDLVYGINNIVESGKEIVSSNLPDVINQLITWNLISNSISAILSFLTMVAFVVLAIKSYKWHKEGNRYNDWFMLTMLSCVLAAAALLIVIGSIMTIVKINLTTKLWLIEYAANLLK